MFSSFKLNLEYTHECLFSLGVQVGNLWSCTSRCCLLHTWLQWCPVQAQSSLRSLCEGIYSHWTICIFPLQEKDGQQKEFYHSCCLSNTLDGAGRSKQRCTQHMGMSHGQTAAVAAPAAMSWFGCHQWHSCHWLHWKQVFHCRFLLPSHEKKSKPNQTVNKNTTWQVLFLNKGILRVLHPSSTKVRIPLIFSDLIFTPSIMSPQQLEYL